jgi:hypothetical protein
MLGDVTMLRCRADDVIPGIDVVGLSSCQGERNVSEDGGKRRARVDETVREDVKNSLESRSGCRLHFVGFRRFR